MQEIRTIRIEQERAGSLARVVFIWTNGTETSNVVDNLRSAVQMVRDTGCMDVPLTTIMVDEI